MTPATVCVAPPGTRVVHLSTGHGAGDIRIVHKECATLARHGYDVTVVMPGHAATMPDGVRFVSLGEVSGRARRVQVALGRAYNVVRRLRADVYHVHDPELLWAAIRLRRAGCRVIYDVHEDVPRRVLDRPWLPPWARAMVGAVLERLERHAIRRVDHLITATPALRERLAPTQPDCETVANFPMLSEFGISPNFPRRRQVCYAGDLTPARGVVEMMEACARAGIPLVLGGRFRSKVFRDACRRRRAWSNVREAGWLDRAGVVSLMTASIAGLVLLHPAPGYREAYPTKLFEYMAAGMPVIASDFPLLRTFVSEPGCGLCVDPFDIEAIAEAVRYLADHPGEASDMGRRGREQIERQYRWDMEEARLLSVYRRVVTGCAPPVSG
jgi:glycosyltransferase involved in cell wall biosynthesis